MPAQLNAQPQILSDVRAAVFVTRSDSSRYFLPFLGRETPAAAVAAELGVDIGSVTYRIGKMLRLGLITRSRIQSRRGRPIVHYRSTADSVFAPIELTPLDSVAALFSVGRRDTAAELSASLEAAWLRFGREHSWGTHLYRTAGGGVNRDFVPKGLLGGEQFWDAVLAERAPAVWDQFGSLELSHAAAKQLQRHLAELLAEYTSTGDLNHPRRRYLIRLALAPA